MTATILYWLGVILTFGALGHGFPKHSWWVNAFLAFAWPLLSVAVIIYAFIEGTRGRTP